MGILVLTACGEGRGSSTGMVRDSAGVRIVENSTAHWQPDDGWRLSPDPIVDIGTTVGDPNYELYRVLGAVRLSTGVIVVANGGSTELRYFDSRGRYLLAAGGQGGGPGEFGWVVEIFRMRGDSVGVDSGNPPRFQVFDANGRFIRSAGRDRGAIRGVFADGSVLVDELALDSIPNVEEYLRPDVRLLRRHADEARSDTLGSFPGTQALYQQHPELGFRMAATRDFLRFTRFAVAGDRIFVADNAEYRVDTYGAGGDWQSSIRWHRPQVRLTDEVMEAWFRSMPTGDDDALVRRRMASARSRPLPETVPAYRDILVDDVGNLWVQEYPLRSGEPQRWTVFDPEGVLLGTMEMPPSFQPYHIGNEFVLGRHQDELDIEHVQLYGLVKPE